jgi:hypothetical protein
VPRNSGTAGSSIPKEFHQAQDRQTLIQNSEPKF